MTGFVYPLPCGNRRRMEMSLVASDTVRALASEPPPAHRLDTPPVLNARRGSLAQRLGIRRLTDHHPAPVFVVFVLCGFLLVAAATVGLASCSWTGFSDRRDRACRRACQHVARRSPNVRADRGLERRLGDRQRLRDPRSGRGRGRLVRASTPLAGRGVRAGRDPCRGGQLPGDDLARPPPPTGCTPPGHLPVNASFPSGHVAASIAVYGGLALLLTSRYKNPWLRGVVWALAVALPIAVGISRMYRGMHHPLDTLGGAAMGLAALLTALFAARVAGVVAARRDRRRVARTAGDEHRRGRRSHG